MDRVISAAVIGVLSAAVITLIYILHTHVEPCRTYLMDRGNGTPARFVIDCSAS